MSSPPPLMSKETTSALIAKFQTLIPGIENLFKVNTTGKDMRTENEKQQAYEAAKKNLKDAPLELSLAEKNVYLYNDGGDETTGKANYNQILFARFDKTADEFKQNSVDKQQEFMLELSQALKQYQADTVFLEHSKNLLKARLKEREKLLKKIAFYDRIILTNQRKVVYEDKDTEGLYTYRRILLFLYYCALVGYIIFGSFIPDKMYLKYSVWAVVIIVALFPLLLNILMKWFFMFGNVVYYWIKDIPHKDVYLDP